MGPGPVGDGPCRGRALLGPSAAGAQRCTEDITLMSGAVKLCSQNKQQQQQKKKEWACAAFRIYDAFRVTLHLQENRPQQRAGTEAYSLQLPRCE